MSDPHAQGHHPKEDQTNHHGHHGHKADAPSTSASHAMHADSPHQDHDKHAGHSVDGFRKKFWLSLVLTIPPLIWGHMLQNALGYTAPTFTGSHMIPAVFGTLVFVYGGWVFLQGAARELRDRAPGMMTLISLAILVAFLFSAAVTLGFPGMPLWEELASLVTIMLLGHWLEMRSITQAQGALQELAKLLPDMATRVAEDGSTEEVPAATLREGDLVLVRPGSSVPADGIVREGTSDVDEAMITGESRPVKKAADAQVIGGTVNGAGVLRVEVTATGEQTALAGIMRLVAEAQKSRSRAQILADRAAFWLTWIALGSATVTLVAWLVVGARPQRVICTTP